MKTEKNFVASFAPHWHAPYSVGSWMWRKAYAVFPLILTSFFVNFFDTLRILLTAIASGLLYDYFFAHLYKQKLFVLDGSTFLTSLLFVCLVPFKTSTTFILIGIFFAVVIAKECFGGAGQGIFQPSLAGLAIIYLLTSVGPAVSPSSFWEWVLNPHAISIATSSRSAVILGILFLLFKGLIPKQVSIVFILTLTACSALFTGDPFYALRASVLFCAFFVMTDYSGLPVAAEARVFFAFLAAIFVFILKELQLSGNALFFGILFANLFSPLLDRFVKPRALL